MKKTLAVVSLAILCCLLLPAATSVSATVTRTKPMVITENHWQVALNNKLYRGSMEVVVPGGNRIDISTATNVIEVEKLSNFPLGIEQVARYAVATGKKPILALYIDGDKDALSLLKEAETNCQAKEISLVLVNSYVMVDDLVALASKSVTSIDAPSSVPAAAAGAATGAAVAATRSSGSADYWITTSSGVRHNSGCRYYMNSKGRKCAKDEGRACKVCGG